MFITKRFINTFNSKIWYPKKVSDLDIIANRVLEAGTDLKSDHHQQSLKHLHL